MTIVATISTVHGHVCLDKPFTSHEHTWEIIEIKEGKEYISCPCGCMETRDHNHKWNITRIEGNTLFFRCDCGCNESCDLSTFEEVSV